ncbi:MAG: DNA-3-methyladenine glycosylase [Acidimicrobiia bacterium]
MVNSEFSELIVPAPDAAKRLLGAILERKIGNQIVRVRIVETEAYDQNDPASHTYKGQTMRNQIMFDQAGFLYVYFIYGMHYCCNVVTGPNGHGEAALIRAVEPISGIEIMKKNRQGHSGITLTNGPSKLCSALQIDKKLNAHYLNSYPLKLLLQEPLSKNKISSTSRIGIKQAIDVPWRFYIKDNPYVSKI